MGVFGSTAINQPTWADYEKQFLIGKGGNDKATHRQFNDTQTLTAAVKAACHFPDSFWDAIKDRDDIALTGLFMVGVAHGCLSKPEWEKIPITIAALSDFGDKNQDTKTSTLDSIIKLLKLPESDRLFQTNDRFAAYTFKMANGQQRSIEICVASSSDAKKYKTIGDYVLAFTNLKTAALTCNGSSCHVPFPECLVDMESSYVDHSNVERLRYTALGFTLPLDQTKHVLSYQVSDASTRVSSPLSAEYVESAILLGYSIKDSKETKEAKPDDLNKEKPKLKTTPLGFLAELQQRTAARALLLSSSAGATANSTAATTMNDNNTNKEHKSNNDTKKSKEVMVKHYKPNFSVVIDNSLFAYVGPNVKTIFVYPSAELSKTGQGTKVMLWAMMQSLGLSFSTHANAHKQKQLRLKSVLSFAGRSRPTSKHAVLEEWRAAAIGNDVVIVPLQDPTSLPRTLTLLPSWSLILTGFRDSVHHQSSIPYTWDIVEHNAGRPIQHKTAIPAKMAAEYLVATLSS